MIPYKNIDFDPNKPVEIYRNLNKLGVIYSIRQNGLVIGHSDKLFLKDCEFIVSEAGRQRVLKEKKKNIHAFIRGYWTEHQKIVVWNSPKFLEISYNPYENNTFVYTNGGKKIYKADFAVIFKGLKPLVIKNSYKTS